MASISFNLPFFSKIPLHQNVNSISLPAKRCAIFQNFQTPFSRMFPSRTFICSKATIETPEKGVKFFLKLTIKTPDDVVLVLLLLNLNIFRTFFFYGVSFVDFEQVNVCWVWVLYAHIRRKEIFSYKYGCTCMDVPYKYTPNCCFNFTQKLENEPILQNN